FDDGSARHRGVPALDVGDDPERVDGPGLALGAGVRIDGDHRARVAGPVKLDAMGVAAAGRRVPPAEVEQGPVVAEDGLDALGPLAVVPVEDLDAIDVDAVVDA